MRRSITEQIHNYILQCGTVTTQQVVNGVSEIAECGGEQRALLLMRLDPQIEQVGTDLWTARSTILSDKHKVHHAAEGYFSSLNRPGAPLSSMISMVVESTHIDSRKVEDILRERYIIAGTNIFNKLRQEKD
ncbi:hypothetical protein [uncultured Sphaerochaeta sp.]|uniref:hypothetical protein n=1 Tax=uncultured Sphaerochaeta sp. TaxID=886478 RepID=UPI002618E0AA|nr:hypothetical protein [uncultured Sphaerochaeta sp.]